MFSQASARATIAIGGTLFCSAAVAGQESACDVPWDLKEILRLGSASGEVLLNPLWALETGTDGRIYMLQSSDHHVSVFTSDGRPLGQVGRAGSGPGEFASPPRRMGWRADTLWVSDRFAKHFFLFDGTPVRQVGFKIPMAAEGSRFAPGTPLADGSAVVFIGEVRPEDEQPTFDLFMIGIAGDTLLHRAIPYVPLPVTGDERMLMRERFAARRAGAKSGRRPAANWMCPKSSATRCSTAASRQRRAPAPAPAG